MELNGMELKILKDGKDSHFILILSLILIRWMSEKLDGVRGYWNGQTMISKHGKEIMCPVWFIEELPKNTSLDGEFWLERGTFELTNGILHSSKDSMEWKRISFFVFDSPNSTKPYETRISDLTNILQQTPNH